MTFAVGTTTTGWDHLGGGTITVRPHGNDDDAKRRFNRTENIRPIPQTDPDSDGSAASTRPDPGSKHTRPRFERRTTPG